MIALPLQGNARKHANSVFVDVDFEPYPDQWEFLLNVGNLSEQLLEDILKKTASIQPLGELSKTSKSKPWKAPMPKETGRSRRNSRWLIVRIGFFRYDLRICNRYFLGYLLDHHIFANVLSGICLSNNSLCLQKKSGFCAVESFVTV